MAGRINAGHLFDLRRRTLVELGLASHGCFSRRRALPFHVAPTTIRRIFGVDDRCTRDTILAMARGRERGLRAPWIGRGLLLLASIPLTCACGLTTNDPDGTPRAGAGGSPGSVVGGGSGQGGTGDAGSFAAGGGGGLSQGGVGGNAEGSVGGSVQGGNGGEPGVFVAGGAAAVCESGRRFTPCVKSCGASNEQVPSQATCENGRYTCPAGEVPGISCPDGAWPSGPFAGCGPWVTGADCGTWRGVCEDGFWTCVPPS